MIVNTVLVLAVTLCVANAAVTVNIFGGGLQISQSPSGVDSCDYNGCDQLCRRLGFPGGACVNDRCKCDNFKQSQGEVEAAPSDKEAAVPELLLLWDDDQENNEIPPADKEDNPIQPEVINLEDDSASSSHSRSARAICNSFQCNSACIRSFYNGGVCLYNRCRCYR